MVQVLLGGLTSLFGGGAAAAGAGATAAAGAGATAAAGAGAATAASGFSLASILQGTATVLSVVSAIGAGNANAEQAEMAASDADAEQSVETLQGINRRSSIRRQMADAVSAQDVAYAASGVDLSFGTAKAARTDAFREGDLGLSTAAGTEQSRISRLVERAANYRAQAKMARRAGLLDGLIGGAKGLQSFAERGAF